MNKESIHTEKAPAAIGPYSQAIRHGATLYVSGQIPLDAKTGKLVEGDIEMQVRRVFDNLKAVAEAGGSDLSRALKVTVFMTDLGNFGIVNEVMTEYFPAPYPARAAIEVAGLPLGAAVEADAILAV